VTRDAANKLSTFNGDRRSNQHKSELAAVTCLNDVCAQEMLPSAEHNMLYRPTHVPTDPTDTRSTARAPARRQLIHHLMRQCSAGRTASASVTSARTLMTSPEAPCRRQHDRHLLWRLISVRLRRSFCHKTLIYQFRPVSSDTQPITT